MDPITEVIAHFIGVFSIQLERARMREDYDEFAYQASLPDDPAPLKQVTVTVHTPYKLGDTDPKVVYDHNWPEFPPLPQEYFQFLPPPTPEGGTEFTESAEFATFPPISITWPDVLIETSLRFVLEPPGSAAIFIRQDNQLLDRDIITNSPLTFDPLPYNAFETQLGFLQEQSDALALLSSPTPPENEDAIFSIIEEAANSLKALHAEALYEQNGTLLLGNDAFGIHTNGADADSIADLVAQVKKNRGEEEDQAPEPAKGPPSFDANGAPDATGTNAPSVAADTVKVIGSHDGAHGEGGYEITLGENGLINEASLVDVWTDAPVMAVLGNHVSLQIIMQTNVWQNVDDSAFDTSIPDLTTNTASITAVSSISAAFADSPREDLTFPENWAIARLDTNLVSFNWLEQFNEVYDEDIVSWEHGGSDLFLQMGTNTSFNLVSLFEFGLQYDLIIVSGSVMQANIIDQRNILLDDDRVEGGDWLTNGGDALAASGNTLWNSAQIHTTGTTNFDSLPIAFLNAANTIGDGSSELSDAILSDPHFAGLDFLNVLYIDGNLLDLNYVRQTNVLSDADQIGLVAGADSGDQTLDAGGNLLANLATIVDFGTDTTAYVGGEVYSDALLHQANLVEDTTPLVPAAPQELASEAVLFLADGMLQPSSEEAQDFIVATSSDEAQTVDVMQSVTG